jgi:Flp pilus assembly protein TadD
LKNYSEAEKYFKQAISKNPASATPYNNLGKIYESQGKRELAKQHFTKAVELDPNNMDAKNNLDRLK